MAHYHSTNPIAKVNEIEEPIKIRTPSILKIDLN